MRYQSAVLIISLILIAGCVQQGAQYVYVCPDGSTVTDVNKCFAEGDESLNETKASQLTNSESVLSQVENEIFDIVNQERSKNGIKELLWNDDIARIAREKSTEMAQKNYFNHESPEGETFSDVLKRNKIFYLTASEDIFLRSGIQTDQELVSSAGNVVEGWLESPAHRVPILDRDEIYTDAGVGAYCRDDICYFTMEFVNLETETSVDLEANYGSFIYIYDPNLEFDYNVTAIIEVNSTRLVDTYIVEDQSVYDLFLQSYPIYSMRKQLHSNFFNTTLRVQKGNGIIVYADPDWVFSKALINIRIRYSS